MRKPVVVSYGRCQVKALMLSLADLPGFKESYECVYSAPEFPGIHSAIVPSEDALKRCEIFFLQIPFAHSEPKFLDRLSPRCKIIRIPIVYCPVLWPQRCVDKREFDHSKYKTPPFFGDRVMFDCMAQGGSEDELLDRYLAKDLAALFKIDRAMAFWERAMKEIDSRSDFPIAPYIVQHFRARRLFTSDGHCTPEVLRVLLAEILRLAWGGGIPRSQVEFATTGRMNIFEVPVHPSLARALNLQWYRDDTLYRHFEEGSFGIRDYMRRYIRQGPCN